MHEETLPVIGAGKRHGTLFTIDFGQNYAHFPEWSDQKDDNGMPLFCTQVTLNICKVVYTFPGRTDRQLFRVLVGPGASNENLTDGLLKAWSKGWAPADYTSDTWLKWAPPDQTPDAL